MLGNRAVSSAFLQLGTCPSELSNLLGLMWGPDGEASRGVKEPSGGFSLGVEGAQVHTPPCASVLRNYGLRT